MKLMTHLYYGDPNEEFSQKLMVALLESGADILEIGIPYTDPICDGEVFQRACKRALEAGTTPYKVFEGIKKIRKRGYKQKIHLTSYYGPIFKIGIGKFAKLAKEASVDGLIIPDILLEEQEELRKACSRYRLSLIQFATVYSDKERLRQICKSSTDFVYCLSLPGVTGERGEYSKLIKLIKLIKLTTKKPIYVGFGIKSVEDIREIMRMGADGVIVGSVIARMYEKNINDPYRSLSKISKFIKSLKESTIEI